MNIGGGIGINYHSGKVPVDINDIEMIIQKKTLMREGKKLELTPIC
jgi:diaminopimelate decarboxylase